MRSHLNDRPSPPIQLNSALPLSLSDALLRALEKTPEDRFATAHEFLTALDATPASAVQEVFSAETRVMPILTGAAQSEQRQASRTELPPHKSGSQITQFSLDDVTKQLAAYIGPIASVVVRRLVSKCTNLDQLYKEAATHITSDADRKNFLGARRP